MGKLVRYGLVVSLIILCVSVILQNSNDKTAEAATYKVAATDATIEEIAEADYVVEGNADDEIQTAINEANSVGGGNVELSSGTFVITTTLIMHQYVNIMGKGYSTEVVLGNSVNKKIIKNSYASNYSIEKIKFNGNKENQTNADNLLSVSGGAHNVTLRDLWIHDGTQDGLAIAGDAYNITIDNIRSYDNDRYGIITWDSVGHDFNVTIANSSSYDNYVGYVFVNSSSIRVSSSVAYDNSGGPGFHANGSDHIIWSGCESYGNEAEGFDLTSWCTSSVITGCIARNNGTIGISVDTGSDYNTVTGNISYINGESGIQVFNSDHNIISSNSCYANGQSTDNTYDNIRLNFDADYNLITSNLCRQGSETNKSKYGLNILTDTCNNNRIKNNDLYDSGQTANLNDLGTATILKDNEE